MNLLALALRNARRNTRRTLLTAAMITLGVALLTIAMAWIEGVLGGALDTAARNIGPVRIVAPEYARREALMPLDAHLTDVEAIVTRARGVAGVRALYPRVSMPVTITADDTLGERFALVQGAPLAYYADELDLDARLSSGELPTGEDDALLGRALAKQLGVGPGAEVVLLGQTQDGSLAPAKVRVAGVDPAVDPRGARARLGYVPEEPRLFDYLSAREMVAFVAELRGGGDVEGALAVAALGGDADRPIAEYSQGMRRRAAIACALVSSPPLLVFDEALNGLDPPSAGRVVAALRAATARGAGVLLSTHVLDTLERVADRVVLIEAGRTVGSLGAGQMDEVRRFLGAEG